MPLAAPARLPPPSLHTQSRGDGEDCGGMGEIDGYVEGLAPVWCVGELRSSLRQGRAHALRMPCLRAETRGAQAFGRGVGVVRARTRRCSTGSAGSCWCCRCLCCCLGPLALALLAAGRALLLLCCALILHEAQMRAAAAADVPCMCVPPLRQNEREHTASSGQIKAFKSK
jgi:hypothetical protein